MNQRIIALKVFGIGLNKTGTTTLGRCGKILGYRGTSYDKGLLEDVVLRKDFVRIKQVVENYELFEDWPWPLIYKELDLMFPGSKFVLTVRKSEQAWFKNLKEHSMRTHPFRHCRQLAYGYRYASAHEKEHSELYRLHIDNVRSYFSGRSSEVVY